MYVAKEGAGGEDTLVPAANPITIHHLLSMTAGMTNTWWYDAEKRQIRVPDRTQVLRGRGRARRFPDHGRDAGI